MAITLNGTTGITTPDVNSDGLTVDSTTLVVDEANNRVGIGTATPSHKLDLYDASGDASINVKSNGTYSNILFSRNGSGGDVRVRADVSNNNLQFITASSERARIDSSGNLLVGTTSNPYTSRQVLAVASGTTLTCMSTTATSYNAAIFNYNTSTQVGYIACTSSATAYVTSSDYRLKENVRPLTGALGRVALLKPCTYTWKSAPNEIGEGFIAHELAEVCPQAVSGEKDAVNEDGSIKPQGIDTSFLVATLTAAIQEQQALITAQQTAIETLEARVAALEAA